MINVQMKRKEKEKEREKEETFDRQELLADYRLAYRSRQVSLIGRREVLSGKAKFGIFGDGKEVAQLAMAKVFRQGDWRSGYYRDQTLMFALGITTIQEFFAQLYAHADIAADPASAGRSMNAHFATRNIYPDGSWKDQTKMYNSAADVSPTGSQMPRLVGLAYASRLYRELDELKHLTQFSRQGNEIAFGTVGNATCAEGMFWEAVNAVGVLKSPMLLSIWDDGYGISVPNEHQLTKGNISAILDGFRRESGGNRDCSNGYDIYIVPAWDYAALVETYQRAAEITRREHTPSIIHVTEVTQPQGHSTSGSHERYKSKERLAWEEEFDCIRQMRQWLITEGYATDEELDELEEEDRQLVEEIKEQAWQAYNEPIQEELQEAADIMAELEPYTANRRQLAQLRQRLLNARNPIRKDVLIAVREALLLMRDENIPARQLLVDWKKKYDAANTGRYGSYLYSPNSAGSALNVPEVKAIYNPDSPTLYGFEVINACFDAALGRDPRIVAFGEDVGFLGDVNQGFAGLQAKYGKLRVSDTGIREMTIMGQAMGLAMRGLRPIAEIQYLDYLLYALQILSDDLATLQWRTAGGQKAPVIVRTRGHRLEGIWHSGSPIAGIIHLIRGMHVLVPRNMTQAAGFYNTLLQAEEPGLVIEVLNGYRLKEKLPANVGDFTIPLGVPEVIRPGSDVTVVTYGALCNIALEAAERLQKVNIDVELIDVRSLLPFDIHHSILKSLQQTNRIVFLDEDVPGGASAYMMQEVIEKQGGYHWLDSEPRTLSAKAHRPAYGSDGNYWSKPNAEEIFETVYDLMHETDPGSYPMFYR